MVPGTTAEATPFTIAPSPCLAGLSSALPVRAPTWILHVHQWSGIGAPAISVCAAITEGDSVGFFEFQLLYVGQVIIDADMLVHAGLFEIPTSVVIFVQPEVGFGAGFDIAICVEVDMLQHVVPHTDGSNLLEAAQAKRRYSVGKGPLLCFVVLLLFA